MSPRDVVEKGTAYDDGTHYLAPLVESLAASSKSGKVVIVTHSNGGLVAKALMEKLAGEGKANLVDKVIFVDVPQLGTPMAVAAMLHGDGEAIGWGPLQGAVISQANARALGENMPDGFALLPSAAYFGAVAAPVADLSGAPQLQPTSGIQAKTISTEDDLERFMTGAGGRQKPSFGDIETPDVLSSRLFDAARALHDGLDSWTPPAGVEAIQIAGWGLDTPSGITYSHVDVPFCLTGLSCSTVTLTRHKVNFTEDGDGTVVTPSQVTTTTWATYHIALRAYNKAHNNADFDHASIMETQAFQQLFNLLLSSSAPSRLPAFVTNTEPISTSTSLRLKVFSPVTLDAYDSAGKHTGLARNPNLHSDLEYVENQIPGSYYERYGEGQYIGLPAGESYTIVMHGTGSGTFTFEAVPVAGGVEQPGVSYAGIPVTASSTATVNISAGNLASTTLSIDYNGDGVADATLDSASASFDPLSYITLMRSYMASLGLGRHLARQLDHHLQEIAHVLSSRTSARAKERGIQMQALRKLDEIGKLLARLVGAKKKDDERSEDEDDDAKTGRGKQLSGAQASAIMEMLERLRQLLASAA